MVAYFQYELYYVMDIVERLKRLINRVYVYYVKKMLPGTDASSLRACSVQP
jgi:hypothetical protein